MQHALPQQSDAGPTVPLALQHFETIDLAFNGAGAPQQGDTCFDGLIIRP
jgi:hypothetical protein